MSVNPRDNGELPYATNSMENIFAKLQRAKAAQQRQGAVPPPDSFSRIDPQRLSPLGFSLNSFSMNNQPEHLPNNAIPYNGLGDLRNN
jgi:hypothetical protein